MTWLHRHTLSLAILIFALAIVGAVFTFARPTYHPSNGTTTVDMTGERHYTVAQVERAFASHAVHLVVANHDGNARHGLIFLAPPRPRGVPSDFLVTLFGTEAKVMFGPDTSPSYDERFGNVDVSYGRPHPDEVLLARIKAAVSDLQS